MVPVLIVSVFIVGWLISVLVVWLVITELLVWRSLVWMSESLFNVQLSSVEHDTVLMLDRQFSLMLIFELYKTEPPL